MTVTSVMAASVPHEPAKKLAQVVPGNILHYPAARLENFAPPRHGRDAEKMIARGARLHPPRAQRFAAITPPMVAEPADTPSNGP